MMAPAKGEQRPLKRVQKPRGDTKNQRGRKGVGGGPDLDMDDQIPDQERGSEDVSDSGNKSPEGGTIPTTKGGEPAKVPDDPPN